MKVALKNAVELVAELADYFDFAVNEECNQWDECDVSVYITAVQQSSAVQWTTIAPFSTCLALWLWQTAVPHHTKLKPGRLRVPNGCHRSPSVFITVPCRV